MNRARKIMSAVMIVLLLGAALAGCGQTATTSASPAASATPEPTPSASTTAEATETAATQPDGPSWSWDTSPVELSVFVAEGWYNKTWDSVNVAFDKMVTEETGLSFKFTGGDGNKLNAIIASGDLPDMMVMWTGYTQRQMLEEQDQLYPLDELIAEHAPTFTSIPDSMKKWFTNTKTGKNYSVANYFYTPEFKTDKVYLTSHNRITARKDILDKFGIKAEDFKTKAGFKAALQKVKDAGFQYNGFDVSPFILGASIPSQSIEFLANYMGVNYEDPTTGKWLDYRKQPETLETMLFLNDLHTNGLLGIESLTMDNSQLAEKVNSGATFVTTGMSASNSNALTTADPNAYMVPVGPLAGDGGKAPYLRSTTSAGWTAMVITKACKAPDRAIRFMEYMMTPDKMIQAAMGVEGVVWTKGADGRAVYTEQFLADKEADPTNVGTKYGIDSMFFTYNDMIVQPLKPLPTDPIALRNLEMDKYYGQFTYMSTPFDELVPNGGTDEAAIDAKLNEIWNQAIAEIITASSADAAKAAYDAAIANMDKEGWEKWYQAQDAKFQERKTKLGLKFASPYNQ